MAAWPRSRAKGTVPRVSASSIAPSTPTDGGAHPTSRTRLSQGAPTLASTSSSPTTRSGLRAASSVTSRPPSEWPARTARSTPSSSSTRPSRRPYSSRPLPSLGDPAAGDVDRHHPEAGRGQPAEGLHVQPVGQQQPAGQHQGEAVATDGHADPAPVDGQAVMGQPRVGGRREAGSPAPSPPGSVGSDHRAPGSQAPRQHPRHPPVTSSMQAGARHCPSALLGRAGGCNPGPIPGDTGRDPIGMCEHHD